ncbi:MAG: hypothetical protein A2W85_11320 [Bacteroidetes bacterium GWF2_41_31]|nr:MAG: hypothetical protein A2W85_11320 [Bacteroidetes bacterium GWF2_41_31]
MGANYQISEKVFTKLNLSRGFRAPKIAELASNGVNEGSLNFVIGVPTLKPEYSLQLDYALRLNSKHVSAELDLFSNNVSNYIFQRKFESASIGYSITDGYSTFKYASETQIYPEVKSRSISIPTLGIGCISKIRFRMW